jgi:DNA processing protein
MEERQAWIALNMVSGVGPLSFHALIQHFGSALRALSSTEVELQSVGGIGPKTARAILSFPAEKSAKQEEERARSLGIRILTCPDRNYPASLAEIPSNPPILYVRGELKDEDRLAIAVVGSRRSTGYGRGVADELAFDLANSGLTVVSGMALGIDTAVHRGALRAKGRTVAVWGSALDIPYPPQNRELAEKIPQSGALLSEFSLGTAPLAGNFPRRNRIISGLSLGVVVVEADERSGALITANFAPDPGREVFAVPGSIYLKGSRGCHRLIQMGAKLVESAEDVLEELSLSYHLPTRPTGGSVPRTQVQPPLEGEEALLYEMLSDQPLHIDDLIVKSRIPPGRVASLLMSLEIKGYCRQERGKQFQRAT